WDDLNSHVRRKVPAFVRDVAKRKAPQNPHGVNNMEDEVVLVRTVERAREEEKKGKPAGEEIVKGAKEVTNKLGMGLARIPAGKFLMGSPKDEKDRRDDEGPQHEVEVSEFYLGIHEVTVGQFRAFVKDSGYRTEAEKGDGAYGYTGGAWKKDAKRNW